MTIMSVDGILGFFFDQNMIQQICDILKLRYGLSWI